MAPAPDSYTIASTDGFFSTWGEDCVLKAWNLEVKAKTVERTAAKAAEITENRIIEIGIDAEDSAIEQFVQLVIDSDYALQVMHHAAATRIPRVLLAIVDSTKGKLVRCVAIEFHDSLMERHRRFVDRVGINFVPFMRKSTTLSWGGVSASSAFPASRVTKTAPSTSTAAVPSNPSPPKSFQASPCS